MSDGRAGVLVRDAVAADEAALVRVLLAADEWAVATTGYLPEGGDLQSLTYALPEGARPDQKRLMTVVGGSDVVGLIDAVAGWTRAGTITAGVFLIHPGFQRRGFGSAALAKALRAPSTSDQTGLTGACS